MIPIPAVPDKVQDVEKLSREIREYLSDSKRELARQREVVANTSDRMKQERKQEYDEFCSRIKEWNVGLLALEETLVEIETMSDIDQKHQGLRLLFKQAGVGKSSFRVN